MTFAGSSVSLLLRPYHLPVSTSSRLSFPALLTSIALASSPAMAEPYRQTLTLQGITFDVQCDNQGSVNTLTLTPQGLEESNEVVKREIDGTLTKAEVADLDANGSPEIYLYVTSAGSGAYGTVIAYAANRKKSLSQIAFPEIDPDSKEAKGYMGHDEFAVVETVFARRFPIYKEGDSNAEPTGRMRQIQYRLKAGEAGWLLEVEKVIEF